MFMLGMACGCLGRDKMVLDTYLKAFKWLAMLLQLETVTKYRFY